MELADESEREIFHLCFAGSWWADEGGEDISEPSQLVCPAYVELLEVMKRALLLG